MKAKFQIKDPGGVEIEMEIAMPLADWKRLAEELDRIPSTLAYPAFALRDAIRQVTHAAEQHFEAEHEYKH